MAKRKVKPEWEREFEKWKADDRWLDEEKEAWHAAWVRRGIVNANQVLAFARKLAEGGDDGEA